MMMTGVGVGVPARGAEGVTVAEAITVGVAGMLVDVGGTAVDGGGMGVRVAITGVGAPGV